MSEGIDLVKVLKKEQRKSKVEGKTIPTVEVVVSELSEEMEQERVLEYSIAAGYPVHVLVM